MQEHRIRLKASDLLIITAALRARQAMAQGARRQRILELLNRLEDVASGNPRIRFERKCVHGYPLGAECWHCEAHKARRGAPASQAAQPSTPPMPPELATELAGGHVYE